MCIEKIIEHIESMTKEESDDAIKSINHEILKSRFGDLIIIKHEILQENNSINK